MRNGERRKLPQTALSVHYLPNSEYIIYIYFLFIHINGTFVKKSRIGAVGSSLL